MRIYYGDHGVPHFHAVNSDFDCKIAMSDLTVISMSGHLRGRDLAAIQVRGERNRAMLYSNWQRARAGKPLQVIEG